MYGVIVDDLSSSFDDADHSFGNLENSSVEASETELTLSKFILHNSEEYNGHKQAEITGVEVNVKSLMRLCNELEKDLDNGNAVTLQLWNDIDKGQISRYTASIHEVNGLGLGRDRLLCGFDNVTL